MVIRRGQVWWADLGEPRGSEPGFRRPVVVVQEDGLTESALATVMVAPLTSNIQRARAQGNTTLKASVTGLPKDSVALTCQLLTLDKEWLVELVGALPPRSLQALDRGLRLTLGLGPLKN